MARLFSMMLHLASAIGDPRRLAMTRAYIFRARPGTAKGGQTSVSDLREERTLFWGEGGGVGRVPSRTKHTTEPEPVLFAATVVFYNLLQQ